MKDKIRAHEIEQNGGEEEEELEEEDLIWTWDPEYASDNCKVGDDGARVKMMG